MAIINPPGWIQALSTHTAAQMRTYIGMLMAGGFPDNASLRPRGGVHPTFGTQLAVTQAGSPNMTVLVAAGAAAVPGSESASQGAYFAVNDASTTLSIAAAHATLARIDIVVINIRDAQYSGANNDAQLQVITGTPASSPVAPSAPANSVIVAQVAVGAGVTSIVNANITDVRSYLSAIGGVINAGTDAARPASGEIQEGQYVWTIDNNRMYLWDGTIYNQVFPGYVKINESILSGTAASVTFSSIPSIYRALKLVVLCRSDTAASATTFNVRFNGDTGANYDVQSAFGQAAGTGAAESLGQTSITFPDMTAASSTATHPATFTLEIPFYSGTTFIKLISGVGELSLGTATAQLIVRKLAGRWRSAAAINSITMLPNAGNFIAGSSFVLYGTY